MAHGFSHGTQYGLSPWPVTEASNVLLVKATPLGFGFQNLFSQGCAAFAAAHVAPPWADIRPPLVGVPGPVEAKAAGKVHREARSKFIRARTGSHMHVEMSLGRVCGGVHQRALFPMGQNDESDKQVRREGGRGAGRAGNRDVGS